MTVHQQWCHRHRFILNTDKTKEIIFHPKSIWEVHVDLFFLVRNKLGLSFLHRLKMFEVGSEVFFYNTMLESLIRYGISAWCGLLTVKSKVL